MLNHCVKTGVIKTRTDTIVRILHEKILFQIDAFLTSEYYLSESLSPQQDARLRKDVRGARLYL